MKTSSIRIILAIACASLPVVTLAQTAAPPGLIDETRLSDEASGVEPCQYEGDYIAGGDSIDCCCGCPSWEFRAGAVVMQRERPDNTTFLTNAGGPEIFNMRQFEFDYRPGIDISAIHHDGCGGGYDLRYFGLFEVSDSIVTGPLTARQVVFGTTPPTVAAFPATAVFATQYESQLDSGEVNKRWCRCPKLTLLAGLRYVKLDEAFDADFVFAGVGTSNFDIDVENNLLGIQAGADTVIWSDHCGRFSLGSFVKGGIFANLADYELTFESVAIGAAPIGAAGSDDDFEASFIAEGGVNFTYHVTCCLSVQLGYQALWLSGVALASDQVTTTGNIFAADAGIDVNGDLFYHGAMAGLVYCH